VLFIVTKNRDHPSDLFFITKLSNHINIEGVMFMKKPNLSIIKFKIHEERRERENIQEEHENLLFIDGFFTEIDITPALRSDCIPKNIEEMTKLTSDCIIDQGFILSELQDEKDRLELQLKNHEFITDVREKTSIKKGILDETWEEMSRDLHEDIENMNDAFNKTIQFLRT